VVGELKFSSFIPDVGAGTSLSCIYQWPPQGSNVRLFANDISINLISTITNPLKETCGLDWDCSLIYPNVK
jgi:hypothetical protein